MAHYFLVHPSIAQEFDLNFKHLTSSSGLSQCVITDIYKDSRGFMWFSTWDGVNRFDGMKIESNDEIAEGLTFSSFMGAFSEDQDGNIWIGSRIALVQYSYNEDRFYSYTNEDGSSTVQNALEYYFPIAVNDSLVLLSSYTENRMTFFNKRKKTFRDIYIIYNEKKDSIVSPVSSELAGFQNILTFCSAPTGKLIFHVLAKNKSGNNYWKPIHTNIWRSSELILRYSQNTIKLVSKNSDFETDTCRYFEISTSSGQEKGFMIDDRITDFTSDENYIYVSTDKNGILFMDKNTFAIKGKISQKANRSESLQTPKISTILISDGILWAGCWGIGISYAQLIPPVFTRHFGNKEATLAGTRSFVRSIVEDRRGHFWCNILDAGIIELDPDFKFIRTLQPSKNHSTGHLFLDKDDNLFFGQKGLVKYNLSSKSESLITHISKDNGNQHAAKDFEYFSPASDGNIYTATLSGIYTIKPKEFKLEKLPVANVDWQSFVEFIHADRYGQLYTFNAWDGLHVLKPENQQYRIKYKNHSPAIPRHLYDQNDSTVWIGTSNGLLKFNSKSLKLVRHYQKGDGLPNNVVYAIAPDTFGYLWLSTNKGISRFNPINDQFFNFNGVDSPLEIEYNRHAVCLARDGRILFGGIDGITAVHPWNVVEIHKRQRLQFTGVKSKKPYNPYNHQQENKPLILEKGTTYLEFDFMGIDYVNPRNIKLLYKLEGVNESWVKTGNPGNVRFVNLKPGKYKFFIKSENGSVNEKLKPLAYYFEIEAYWWQTLWAKWAGILILLLGLILGIRNYIQNRVKQERAELEEQLAIINERERIIADLHDDVGATLSSMKIYSELAQKAASVNAEKTTEFVNKVAQHSKSLMQMMSDIIWSLKANSEQMSSIKSNVLDHFADVLETKEINLHIQFDEDLIFKHPHMRKNIVLVIKEAMNNIIKYSAAKNAYLSMQRMGDSIHLHISDDGIGLNLGAAKRGNGLNNIQRRCQDIGASCAMKSSPGEGLSIDIYIPFIED